MSTRNLSRSRLAGAAIALASTLVLLSACGGASPTPPQLAPASSLADRGQTIILGDVDPDEPAKKIKRFQPLADYLALHLDELGILAGKVVIARNIDEMGEWLKRGEVDIYFDSAFPALVTQEKSGSEFLLRRSKEGVSSYWSTYVALADGGIDRVEDFVGKIVAFEEPRSTSGFILPAGSLVQQGFTLRRVDGPDSTVAPDEVGYFFSRDEENTIELVLRGRVAAGGISNQDYQELPPELMQQLVIFDQTITVPRQIVSVRPGLEPALKIRVRELLLGLKETEEGRTILEGLKESAFDPLPSGTDAALAELKELIRLVSGD